MITIRLLTAGAICCLGIFAQETSPAPSENWQDRAAAVRKLLAQPDAVTKPDLQDTLIRYQEREDSVLDKTDQSANAAEALEDEAYGDTYLNLLGDAVYEIAKKTGNQRAYEALLRSAYNPDSELGKFLASNYENLPTLTRLAHDPGVGQRSSAIGVIGTMIAKAKTDKSNPLTQEDLQNAKSLVTRAAEDPGENPAVRQTAIESIAEIRDPKDADTLKRIAVLDQTNYKTPDGTLRFPLREAAMKALQKIKPK